MIEADIPENEAERISRLRSLNILDTPIEERFERITRTVRNALGVSFAALTIIDESRQWFKSVQGSVITEAPRKVAFCTHTILQDGMLIVPDTASDPRFCDNPFVVSGQKIRFYAGHPLYLATDIKLGTLCVMDTTPHGLSGIQAVLLRDLARMAEAELFAVALSEEHRKLISELSQAQREARIDVLTRLWNRTGIEGLLHREWDFSRRQNQTIACMLVEFDNIKAINIKYGKTVGDEVIREGSHRLMSELRSYDMIGRWDENQFMIILPRSNKSDTEVTIKRMKTVADSAPVSTSIGPVQLTVSTGAFSASPARNDCLENLLIKLLGAVACRDILVS
jgi:diguanylate cyclase (GGDEF)-like protein